MGGRLAGEARGEGEGEGEGERGEGGIPMSAGMPLSLFFSSVSVRRLRSLHSGARASAGQSSSFSSILRSASEPRLRQIETERLPIAFGSPPPSELRATSSVLSGDSPG